MKRLQSSTALSCLLQPGYHLQHARRHVNQTPADEAGLTLLECVVAIAVIALTGAMIGPPLVMAAATRVQNRRAEQALQLAQGEVDRVRAMVVRGEGNVNLLPAISTKANLAEQDAPDATSGQLRSPDTACATPAYDATNASHVPSLAQALPVDVNGDCDADFLIQTFRFPLENEDTTAGTTARDFQMMTRVYSARASNHFGSLEVEEASLGFTSGEGSYWKQPLAVLTTRVNQSDTDAALCGYHGLNSADEDGVDNGDC